MLTEIQDVMVMQRELLLLSSDCMELYLTDHLVVTGR